MTTPDQSSFLPETKISEVLDQMWRRYRSQVLERVAVLEAAAAALSAKNLTASECEAAHAAAHKLAGTLGMFNLERGTVLARELETAYTVQSPPPAADAFHLARLAAELRAMIENRKSSSGPEND